MVPLSMAESMHALLASLPARPAQAPPPGTLWPTPDIPCPLGCAAGANGWHRVPVRAGDTPCPPPRLPASAIPVPKGHESTRARCACVPCAC